VGRRESLGSKGLGPEEKTRRLNSKPKRPFFPRGPLEKEEKLLGVELGVALKMGEERKSEKQKKEAAVTRNQEIVNQLGNQV